MMNTKIKLAATVAVICCSPVMATAGLQEYTKQINGQEASGRYNIVGPGIEGQTATGAYGMTIANGISMGYVEPGATTWQNAKFTAKAQQYGVNSHSSMLNTSGGHAMQDALMTEFSSRIWGELNSNTKSIVGNSISGVTINEAGLMSMNHMLGSPTLNNWAKTGYTVSGLQSLSNIGTMVNANRAIAGIKAVMPEGVKYDDLSPSQQYQVTQALHEHLVHRASEMAGVDISDITNGTFIAGGGSYIVDSYIECAPDIGTLMAEEGANHIMNANAMAQDQNFGFSQMNDTFGNMSCIDFAFTGGLDILFSPPDLSQIANQVMAAACAKVQSITGDASTQLANTVTGAFSNAGFGGIQNGPLAGAFGIQAGWNTGSSNLINTGIDPLQPDLSAYGISGGTTNGGFMNSTTPTGNNSSGGMGGGFDALFY